MLVLGTFYFFFSLRLSLLRCVGSFVFLAAWFFLLYFGSNMLTLECFPRRLWGRVGAEGQRDFFVHML